MGLESSYLLRWPFTGCDIGALWESQDVEERKQLSSWQLISPGPLELHSWVDVSTDVRTRWYVT